MWNRISHFLLLCCCYLMMEANKIPNLQISITNGELNGKIVEVADQQVQAFLGIPYAQPPIGDLRFQRPKPLNGKYTNKGQQPNICHQTDNSGYEVLEETFHRWNPSGEMSEDCLYLNVHAPNTRETDLDTVVWIHGGGFYKGSISLDLYDPKYIVAKEGVIVFSIQYRLGSFGLLYMGEDEIPGNMGLLDQAMAIQWVSDNIESFGGSSNKITLMGESAGSASVGYHMISKKTRNLFQKVIMMSGSPFNFWAYTSQKESRNRALLFAAYAGCKNNDYQERRSCLLNKTPQELLAADKSHLSMTPTLDGDFIHKSPFDAIKDNDYVKKPTLAGLVRNEGMPGIVYFLRSIRTVDYDKVTMWDYIIFVRMMAYYTWKDVLTFLHLGQSYADRYKLNDLGNQYSRDWGEAADQLFGDFFISCAAIDFFDNLAKSNADLSYFYYFNHRSKVDKDPAYTDVMHGGELQYLFGRPFRVHEEYDDVDRTMSERLMKTWTRFIKTGVPDEGWSKYNSSSSVNIIETDNEVTSVRPRNEFCKLWHTQSLSYYETVEVSRLCSFLDKAVWEVTNFISSTPSWWFTSATYCYNW